MINMVYFSDNKTETVEFVTDLLHTLSLDWRSITIIKQEKLGGCFVRIATDTSSVDIVERLAQGFSLELMNI